jgi:hypothetical protein
MNPIVEGNLTFTFSPAVIAEKYEAWQYYINVFQQTALGTKAMDIAVIEDVSYPRTLFLLEVKDFRVITTPPNPENVQDLHGVVAKKARDTLAGLTSAATGASVASEKAFAIASQGIPSTRIVVHLEPNPHPSIAIFPSGFSSLVLQKLRQTVAHIDPNPMVLSIATTPHAGVPWSVT